MMLMMMTGFNRKPVTVEQPEGENKSQSHQVHASFCFFYFLLFLSFVTVSVCSGDSRNVRESGQNFEGNYAKLRYNKVLVLPSI
jgi:hypothetical protein